jgi:N-acetylglucosamine-6-phosphate deacetylase
MRLTGAQVFHPRKGFVLGEVCAGNGVLTEQSGDKAVDLAGCYVIPGLIDLHFHGCVGEDFSDATPDGLQKIADYQLSRGITGICPAGMTLGEDTLTAICENAAAHIEGNKPGAELLGLHLEGPFISMAKKGAQNGDFVHDPDGDMLERLQKAAKGHVKLVTLAPEGPGAIDFIRKANELGVRVSLGHTTADYDTATAAYNAGARQATHLFNAMPSFTHREPGVIGAAADHEEVMAELICDGVHVHASAVRAMFRLFGPKRMILISDSLRAAGMGDGEYPFGGQYIEVHGARATILGHPETLAGSVSDLMGCVKKATEFGVSLWAAVTAASVNPAKALGVYDRLGSLDAGKDANFAVLNTDYTLKAVVFHGQVVSGAL